MENNFLVYHVKYNRDVVYGEKVELEVSEFKKMLEDEFNSDDLEYLVYHNPSMKYVVGEKIHPSSKFEQLIQKKNFFIELV